MSLPDRSDREQNAVDAVAWLRRASTDALLEALALMDPSVAVPYTESDVYKELSRAIKGTEDC